jgi:predicted GIY-YIG superfamily endonuclease
MLYRFYDSKGQLLYVGITDSPHTRWATHARKNAEGWWADVCVVHSEWHPTRAEAEAAEVKAIRREDPLHNVSHSTVPRKWRRLSSTYLHPMAREEFGDQPFTYQDLVDRLGIPYGTVAVRARALVAAGAFEKVGERARPTGRGPRTALFVAAALSGKLMEEFSRARQMGERSPNKGAPE